MTHVHAPRSTDGPHPFEGCVAPFACDPAAHGGHVAVEVCACGAERDVARNNGHREEGAWREVR